jgi:hypothetical protein
MRTERLSPILTRCHADQLGEPRAERAQRREPDRETDLGHTGATTSQHRCGALDAASHEIAVRRLTERKTELPTEMAGRHVNATSERIDIQRSSELAIYSIPHTPHIPQTAQFPHRRHNRHPATTC